MAIDHEGISLEGITDEKEVRRRRQLFADLTWDEQLEHQQWRFRRDQERARARKAEISRAETEAFEAKDVVRRAAVHDTVKDTARRQWMHNGGDAKSFETAWPGLWERYLAERTAESIAGLDTSSIEAAPPEREPLPALTKAEAAAFMSAKRQSPEYVPF